MDQWLGAQQDYDYTSIATVMSLIKKKLELLDLDSVYPMLLEKFSFLQKKVVLSLYDRISSSQFSLLPHPGFQFLRMCVCLCVYSTIIIGP